MRRDSFSRFELLIGHESLDILQKSTVAIFGLGGVGSFAAEALARAGVGSLVLVDGDVVAESNINRQLPASHSTIGRLKAEIMRERASDINPDARVSARSVFFDAFTAASFDFTSFDYVVDAIDTVSSKLILIQNAKNAGTPIISSMGAGNRLDPSLFEIADIYETSGCPLARVMRRELRRAGIPSLKVVYSKEPAAISINNGAPLSIASDAGGFSRPVVGSSPFVPPVAGFILSGEVVRDLISIPAGQLKNAAAKRI